MSLRAAVGEDADFVWCLSGCGAGQIHETGRAQPIVTCVQCKHRSCFIHQVPWHEGLSCTDYDATQNVHRGSKRQIDIDDDDIEERMRKRQKQEDDDRLFAQVRGTKTGMKLELALIDYAESRGQLAGCRCDQCRRTRGSPATRRGTRGSSEAARRTRGSSEAAGRASRTSTPPA